MKIKSKIWIAELVWIAFLFSIALLIDILIFKQFSVFSDTIDIQIHATYFVIGGVEWVLNIFILIATITYVIKETIRKYNHVLPNVILAILMVAFLFIILLWHRNILFLQALSGSTVFPPLNALPEAVEPIPDSLVELWNIALLGFEFIITIGIFLLGFKTGKLTSKIENTNVN